MGAVRKLSPLLCVAALACFVSCNDDVHLLTKPFEKGLPEVRIESTTWENDTLVIASRIVSEGLSPLSFAGVCYRKDSVPDLSDATAFVDFSTNGAYTVRLTGFTPYDEYIVRPTAGNEHGYALGDTVRVTVPYPGPPEVPCTLPPNLIAFNVYDYTVSYANLMPDATYGDYEVVAYCQGNAELRIYFNEPPANGVYTTNTVSGFENNPNHVFMQLHWGLYMYPMVPGGDVFVVENDNGTTTISFCDLSFQFTSSTVPITGSFDFD